MAQPATVAVVSARMMLEEILKSKDLKRFMKTQPNLHIVKQDNGYCMYWRRYAIIDGKPKRFFYPYTEGGYKMAVQDQIFNIIPTMATKYREL